MSQLTLDSAILETLLERAASAARRVGYIQDSVDCGPSGDLLANDIDAIVHELSELLGNPHLIAVSVANARSTFAPKIVTRNDTFTQDGLPALVAPEVLAVCRTLSLIADDAPTKPHARLRGSTQVRKLQHVERALTTTSAEPAPADGRQACVYRAMTSQRAPSAARWSRLAGATLIAFVLLGVIVLVVAGGVL